MAPGSSGRSARVAGLSPFAPYLQSVRRTLIDRRDFLRCGLGMLATPLVGGAPSPPGALGTQNNRLTARPRTPTVTPKPGLTALGLDGDRDGLLYVPTSYTPDTAVPLFVALHGAGGKGASWQGYPDRAEAKGIVLLAPDSRSRTWDAIMAGTFGPDVRFLDDALRYTFRRCRIDPRRIALGGFSDGASYALSLGAANGDLFSHLVAFSPGFYGPGGRVVGRPRVYVSHGTQDVVLPFTTTRDRIIPTLRNAGYDVTFREFDGGHGVPPEISDGAMVWFTQGQ